MFGGGGTSGFGGFGQQNNQQQSQQQQLPAGQSTGLFGQAQQNPTPSFGGFGAQQQQPATSGFGTQNASSGTLFGQQQPPPQQQQPQSGFSFGQTMNSSSPFGGGVAQNTQPKSAFGGFGTTSSTGTTGFGGFGTTQPNPAQPAFGAASNTTNNAFGAKPGGSLFGQPQSQPQTSAFGQPSTSSGGLFGNVNQLGAQQTGGMPTQGSSNPQYQPFVNTEKDATGTGSTTYQYNTITCMPAYRSASIEELRVQDYQQGRKTGNAGPMAGAFGQTSTGGFGASTSGSAGGGLFGQPAQQQQTPAFGGFGQANQQQQQQQPQSGGLFGSSAPANTGTGLFGQQSQPQAGGLFGQNNQQQSSGFTFGQPQPQQQQPASSGFSFGQNTQQQQKPGGLFGGSGLGTSTSQPSAFSFGGTSQTQQPASTGFGAGSTGGFTFGGTSAASNQPKPGGLFGSTSSAPAFGGFGSTAATASTDANKPAFSFGGAGGNTFGAQSGAPGQTTTAAPSTGLFGAPANTANQASTGFSFGAPANNTTAGQSTFSFGSTQPQAQQTGQQGSGFGGGSLFGQSKPATGGLFGSSTTGQQNTQQQPGLGGAFNFGASNTQNQTSGGGLFGNLNKPAGGGLFGSSTGTGQSGGLFGGAASGQNTLGQSQQQQSGSGLFSSTSNNQGGLFGTQQNNNALNGGGGLFGGSTFGTSGTQTGGLFGIQSQGAPQLQMSLGANPYGTDSLFGGAASLNGASRIGANAGLQSQQPLLPFDVSRPSPKKQPPLVPPFRPAPRAASRLSKLRGTTPSTAREGTPGREGTPSRFNGVAGVTRVSSPSAIATHSESLFRGVGDSAPFQREGSMPAQAFVGRPSVKRLVLNDQTNFGASTQGRSQSLFTSRAPGMSSEATPGRTSINDAGSLFGRTMASTTSRVAFSPALETASSKRLGDETSRVEGEPDESSFVSSVLGNRRGNDSNGGVLGKFAAQDSQGEVSGVSMAASKTSEHGREDALLPLDYYTSPPLSELREWSHAELSAVEGFIVGRRGFGSVEFAEAVDLTGVGELSNIPGGIVQLRRKECYVYPDEEDCYDEETGKERDGVQPGFDPKRVPNGKAKRGEGLNVPAVVRLEGCWPIDRSTREAIKDGDHVRVKQMINKLKRRKDMDFKSYEPISGTWSFKVEHFSRYGLDSDEDDEEDSQEATKADTLNKTQHAKGADKSLPAEAASKVAGLSSVQENANRNAHITDKRDASRQPWAATLGLEPRRLHVMQASFFGDSSAPATGPQRLQSNAISTPKSIRSHKPIGESRITQSGAKAQARGLKNKRNSTKEGFELAMAPISIYERPTKLMKAELHRSLTDGDHAVISDAGLIFGRSFRVGWGPGGMLAYRTKVLKNAQNSAEGDESASRSSIVLSKVGIFPAKDVSEEKRKVQALLEIQLRKSTIETDGEDEDDHCPVAIPHPDFRFRDLVAGVSTIESARYESSALKLASALYDEIDLHLPQDASQSISEEAMQIRRKSAIEMWLTSYVRPELQNEIRAQLANPARNSGERIIFSYLTGGLVEDACKKALDIGDMRLATLIAQANCGGTVDDFQSDLQEQLAIWRASGVDSFLSSEQRRIYELLAGNTVYNKANGVQGGADKAFNVPIAAGLDWARAFNLFFHFNQSFESQVAEILAAYEACVGEGEGEDVIRPPLPPYLERDVSPGSKRFRDLVAKKSYPQDLLFALLKSYAQPGSSLTNVLDPLQYGASPCNFSLAFHISHLLCCVIEACDFDDRVDFGVEGEAVALAENLRGNSAGHDNLCTHFAFQLEVMGMWTWAAFVLMHLEMLESRRDGLKALLTRNATCLSHAEDRAFVVDTLKIPVEWLEEAQAIEAGNRNDKFAEFHHFIRAKKYGSAHRVALDFLAPEAIIRHDFALLLDLFAPLKDRSKADVEAQAFRKAGEDSFDEDDHVNREIGKRSARQAPSDTDNVIEISGWQEGGQVYLDYIAVCRSLPWLVASQAPGILSAFEEEGRSDHIISLGWQEKLGILRKNAGEEVMVAAERINAMCESVPRLIGLVHDLFDAGTYARGDATTLKVAHTQMIASLHNCIRSLQFSHVQNRLADYVPSLKINMDIENVGAASTSQGASTAQDTAASLIEIEDLQFMANSYCAALVECEA